MITHTKGKYSSQSWQSNESQKAEKNELECLLLILIYSSSKFNVTCKNEEFDMRVHQKSYQRETVEIF